MSIAIHANYTEEKILECIDAGIDVFGSTVKNVIYWRLKSLSNLDRKDIIRKPEIFSECLRTFFGERAFNVEAAIVASILGSFHLPDVALSDSATRAIVSARKMVQSSN
ncbi:MAG: hypothetical protein ACHQ1H_02145 [Nitrososphaerales archaeon]